MVKPKSTNHLYSTSGMLDILLDQPPNAFEMDEALREWRLLLEKRGTFKTQFSYTKCFLRHALKLEWFGAKLSKVTVYLTIGSVSGA